ncbi:glycosyltransferase [Pseudomonas sp. N040]|nr:glycosyltransferase [Pseudomonas sp. N040]MBW7014175.1 glycosyltransferase [Pseudomonas sp. N040]
MRWLPAQVDSILKQAEVDVVIYVSVDLSSDGTAEWVAELARNNPRVVLLGYGERYGGAAKNFLRLIRDVDFSAFDYLALADQDDIWFADKLDHARRALLAQQCAAYSGNALAFWPDGREVLLDKAQPQVGYDYLFESAGPGCSYVFTVPSALQLKAFVLQHWAAACEVGLHDWLFYAWYRAAGFRWFIDPCPKIRYRQHASNQFGANSGLRALKSRLGLVQQGWYRAQTRRIVSLLQPLLPQLHSAIDGEGNLSKRFLLQNLGQLRRRRRDRAFLLCIILLGLY